jgi:hypothetical protein
MRTKKSSSSRMTQVQQQAAAHMHTRWQQHQQVAAAHLGTHRAAQQQQLQ